MKLTPEERALTAVMGNAESDVLAMKRAQASARERGRGLSLEALSRGGADDAPPDDDEENANAPPPAKKDTWPGTEADFRKQCDEMGADPDTAVAKFRAAGGSFRGDDDEDDEPTNATALVRLDHVRSIRGEAPTEFRIWSFGKVETTKGTFLFDKKAAASVMQAWQDWGNRLTFDYGHDATLGAKGEDGKSAGSCNLELRADGLYAVDVRWTRQAATGLADREWLYFSPTFLSDTKTGRIKSLVNIALTNVPATKNLAPLVAAHGRLG
jgi:hypothetical protein